MSAQTKIFMDRCFALPAYNKDPFRGKRVAIAMAYGDTDPFTSGCLNALRTFQDAFRYTGSLLVGMVYGSAMDAGEIRSNEKLMEDAFELGKKLIAE
jgi:multimeric flavodoxin WrbA